MEEEFVNKKETSNYVDVQDEEDIEMLKNQVEAIESELLAFEEKAEDAVKLKARYEEQWAVDKEEIDLQLEHFGMPESNYTHKIHYIPRFWELQKIKFQYKVESQIAVAEGWMEGQDAIIKQYEEQIVMIKEQFETVKNQLVEANKND